MNAVLVLKALLIGIPVKIQDCSYCLSTDYRLCVPGRNETTQQDVLLAVNFGNVTIQDFIALAEQATPDEILHISANLVLNDL
ncbi:MAG: hypothetical protein HS103_06315 [Anaerolineales bacterium]|nr:hypothetical protein [Anaerolineales bacterium]